MRCLKIRAAGILLIVCLALCQSSALCAAPNEPDTPPRALVRTEQGRLVNGWEDLLSLFSLLSAGSGSQPHGGWATIEYSRAVYPDKDIYILPGKGFLANAVVAVSAVAGGWEHAVYHRLADGSCPQQPDMRCTTRDGSFFSGLYADMNGDGWPDLLRPSSKKFGLFDAKAVSSVAVHLFAPQSMAVSDQAAYTVRRKGFFIPSLNGYDIDGDGRGDLIFCDVTHGALSAEQLAEAMWSGNLTLRLYVYLSGETGRGFAEKPSTELALKVGLGAAPDIKVMPTPFGPVLRSVVNGNAQEYFYDARAGAFKKSGHNK